MVSGRFRYGAVRVEYEFHCSSLVEIGIAFGCLLERDHLRIEVRDGDAIVQDRLHELTIVAQDRRLAGKEGMRFRPAETELRDSAPFAACLSCDPGSLVT